MSGTTIGTRFTFSTQKAKSLFTSLTATKFIFLLSLILVIPQISALELGLSFPETVSVNEEFTAVISADTTDNYDVKIFIHDSADEKISRSEYVSEIFQDGWQDPWFYLSGTFPEKSEYRIRATSSTGDRNICVRLRLSENKESNFEQKCYSLKVLGNDEEQEEEPEEEPQTKQEQDDKEGSDKTYEKAAPSKEAPVQSNTVSLSSVNVQEERIVLNPTKNISEKTVVETKSDTKRNVIIYSFMAFCVLLLILIALRKL